MQGKKFLGEVSSAKFNNEVSDRHKEARSVDVL